MSVLSNIIQSIHNIHTSLAWDLEDLEETHVLLEKKEKICPHSQMAWTT